MLKVTVEVMPGGSIEDRFTIAEINIANTLRKNEYNEYEYKYGGWYKDEGSSDMHLFKGRVNHWREHPALLLIYKVLFNAMKVWIKTLY
jgi:hypothetical protein